MADLCRKIFPGQEVTVVDVFTMAAMDVEVTTAGTDPPSTMDVSIFMIRTQLTTDMYIYMIVVIGFRFLIKLIFDLS
jgi:hypothetical protein